MTDHSEQPLTGLDNGHWASMIYPSRTLAPLGYRLLQYFMPGPTPIRKIMIKLKLLR